MPLAIALLAACLLAAGPLAAQRAPLDTLALEATLREEMAATSTPGVSIAIVQGGEVVWARGFGVTSVEDPRPVTPETLFRIGSTTKVFTGLAALALERAGKLRLDAPISDVASGLHPAIGALTVDRLLTHTGGLVSLGAADGPHDDEALGERVRAWGPAELVAPPGDLYSYSGPSYWLAGYVIERAADEPYADAVERLVLDPLGMERSTFRPLVALTHPLALDHRVGPDGRAAVMRPYSDDVTTWPSGSLFSSASELARLAIALADSGRVPEAPGLAPALVEGISTGHAAMTGGACEYTYGLARCEQGGHVTLGHYGFRVGSGSVLTMVPSRGIGIVILANRNGGIFARTEARALELLGVAGEEEEADPPPALGPAPAGAYANGPDSIVIAERDGAPEFRFRGDVRPIRYDDDGTLLVLGPEGEPIYRFLVLRGAVTNDWYLSDGQVGFRRREGIDTVPPAPEEEVLAVVRALFDAIRAKDAPAMTALFAPGARLVGMRQRPGQPPHLQALTAAEFAEFLLSDAREWNERMWDPEVRVDRSLATVWTGYDFHRGGVFSHCGTDAIQLLRLAEGWKIVSIADTYVAEGCPQRVGPG